MKGDGGRSNLLYESLDPLQEDGLEPTVAVERSLFDDVI